jgi:hypothetical protein
MSRDSLCLYAVLMCLAFHKCVLIAVLDSVLLTCLDGLIIQVMLYCLVCRMNIVMYPANMNIVMYPADMNIVMYPANMNIVMYPANMNIVMYPADMNIKAHSCLLFFPCVFNFLIGKLPKNGIQIIFKVMKRK